MTAILPLAIEGISLHRGGRRILGPVSWRLDGHGITILMGPNGSGKTSLLRAIHGLERVREGHLHWAAPEDIVRRGQTFVFQTPILMRRSVCDCIAYPLRLDGVARAEARARAAEIGARVGLSGLLQQPAETLSGGEKQKLALARAMIRAPQLLLLDEPCASLDPRATAAIETVLRGAAAAGTRIVMSTHDAGQARRLADDILFLHDGRLTDAAPARAFFDGPRSPEATAHMEGVLLP